MKNEECRMKECSRSRLPTVFSLYRNCYCKVSELFINNVSPTDEVLHFSSRSLIGFALIDNEGGFIYMLFYNYSCSLSIIQ